MNLTIAVLITCHNRKEKTIQCLQALSKAGLPENFALEIFLVDDGSNDGTSDAVNRAFPEITLIHGDGNLYWNRGMCRAWTTAIQKKKYDYYLWLNDDSLLFEYALKKMLEYSLSVQNNRIVVGATCSKIDGSLTYSGFKFPKQKLTPNGTWQDCDYFNGNIVLIPNSVYSKVGLLDHKFRHALGDFDYGMRASKLGLLHSLSPQYLGNCEYHESAPLWRNPNTRVLQRIKHLYSPLGNNPVEFFTFDRRHFGLSLAITHFFSIHLRALLPSLWKSS